MQRKGFVVATLCYAAAVGYGALVWPERVALHFGTDLRADSYSSRGTAILVAVVLGLCLVAMFVGLAALVGRIPIDLLNVPHPSYWKQPEHVAELRRRSAEDIYHLGAVTMLFLVGVLVLAVQASTSADHRLSGAAPILLVGYLGYLIGWTIWLWLRRYRPPAH
ncbi:DUF1648 domain-containing protein [Micromonospora sp. CP22]|uniref:DUF1648 domain-containing protein n=1 Tax=Micromonospora sp. CP22 TaxID=2580517 RepID=UPI0012BC7B56|nr:DUF1648 domain-containing protein [Micromonospora sp. CP22]MTK02649.1 DUF1648 domain-containing protein [Micromonospora sp. CP22]